MPGFIIEFDDDHFLFDVPLLGNGEEPMNGIK
jgi:hypothetical protein